MNFNKEHSILLNAFNALNEKQLQLFYDDENKSISCHKVGTKETPGFVIQNRNYQENEYYAHFRLEGDDLHIIQEAQKIKIDNIIKKLIYLVHEELLKQQDLVNIAVTDAKDYLLADVGT